MMDLTISIITLLVLSPLFLLISIIIKATSEGPVLYKGTVIGKDGVPFTYYKFRTMYVNNDPSVHREFIERYVKENKPFINKEGEKVYKYVSDPRVTPFGKILRRFSLDEIPQMMNVIKGQMSIVGPRPPVPYEYEHYEERHKERLKVLPGITGLNQITGRSNNSFEEMVAKDLEYIQSQCLWLDITIMLKTPLVMIRDKMTS